MFKKIIPLINIILRGTLIMLIVLTALAIKTMRVDISELNTQLQITKAYFDRIITHYTEQLESVIKIEQELIKTDIDLYRNLKQIVKTLKKNMLKFKKLAVLLPPDYNFLEKANLNIINYTQGTSGSGTLIKIKDKFYVLTAAHMIGTDNDILFAEDNIAKKGYILSIVKYNRWNDLAILKIKLKKDDSLKYYALEIGTESPQIGEIIYVIGNPDSYEDILTSGVVVKRGRTFSLISAPIYFGNSGGAVIYKGKLVGIVSALSIRLSIRFLEPDTELWWFEKSIPYFIDSTFGIIVNLEIIKEFLEDV